MNETARLKELYAYHILDTDPDKELDDLAELAAALCDTPMAIISFIDETRQWYKARIGVTSTEVKRQNTFCERLLQNPSDILLIEDTLLDDIFCKHPMVLGNPNLRFYASVPFLTETNHIIGTLCVMHTKPMTLSKSQINGLKILAKNVMDFLNARKLILMQKTEIDLNLEKLVKLTNHAPCVIYQFERTPDGKTKFEFISKSIEKIHPLLKVDDLMIDSEIAYQVIHPDDRLFVQENLMNSYTNLTDYHVEYRALNLDNEYHWYMGRAVPERREDGSVVWYGTIQDITNRVHYEQIIEQIAFDISHVLRRPVASLLGLTSYIKNNQMDEQKLREYSNYISIVSKELDSFTKKLNEKYRLKRKIIIDPKFN